ncbi:PRELI domain-containing protein 1, mitochondrial-like isoform X2 [Haliotis rufescens]|nr:PRELI domain-containing protein 1, mitochondrial-like isoform X2 [Haliotis rufescens]XP_046368080.2 PRELI domain-containing protein 1, mitochondrial-like isoform X2 [Haliotis rufescens]XP_046368081.2 PRELI domain-containing protein 1, mitochondrial-like isoform X2 [Haliotis rufescens]XP_046368082.2 PRELI domain-containing protein 1, mitochondrial-like isoform X2 [Haliotis rufescens]XP_046368083.2 PRELI domain-containing protein 1, mitochondrial-like isoform X2 [Haliotis rufescens]
MVKFHATSSVFKYSWDQVACAFWQRYPNPFSKHVLTEDVVNREMRQDGLHTTRLLTKTNPVPKWGERFVPGPRQVCIVEESIVDPEKKIITTYSRNIGMQKLMSIEEKCVYKVNPDNGMQTLCERSAWITSSVFGLGYAIQKFGVERFKKNITKSCKGYDYILDKLFSVEAQTAVQDHTLSSKDKIKDTARKAAEVAAAKARPILSNPRPIS